MYNMQIAKQMFIDAVKVPAVNQPGKLGSKVCLQGIVYFQTLNVIRKNTVMVRMTFNSPG